MKIEIIGKSKLGDKEILGLISKLSQEFKIEDENTILEIIFLDPKKIRKLNQTYRKMNTTTDVLSFPQISVNTDSPVLGSIAICEQIAKKLGETTPQVLIHGFMHLSGLDHETNEAEWDKAERKIYAKIEFQKIN